MNRRTTGTLCGLALVVACQGGGSPNDFGSGPGYNAPTDPGAPSDPNAPPPNPNDPPFSDDVPGSAPSCGSICRDVALLCANEPDDYDECVRECTSDIPARCLKLAGDLVLCAARNDCNLDLDFGGTICGPEVIAYVNCFGPQPPDGEGGAGGQ
jgi:hypothetical protein